jgi:hypothetical protein
VARRLWEIHSTWAFGEQREIWEIIPDTMCGHRVAVVDNKDDAEIIVRAVNHLFERSGELTTLLPDGTYKKLSGDF